MDFQKRSFIKPAESCPHWLKIKLWKELGRLVQKYGVDIFLKKLITVYHLILSLPNTVCFQILLQILFQIWEWLNCLYYLLAHFHSCCFYIQYHGGMREINPMPVLIFYFILGCTLLTRWRNIRLSYTMFLLKIQKRSRSRFEPVHPPPPLTHPPKPLFVAKPLILKLISVI